MDKLSILQLLRADPRPTIVVDLDAGREIEELQAAFRNEALRSWPGLWDHIVTADKAARDFGAWVLGASFSPDGYPSAESYEFYGITWTQFTVASRWRVVSGLQTRELSSASSEDDSGTRILTPLRSGATTPTNGDMQATSSTPDSLSKPKPLAIPSTPLQNWSQEFHDLLKTMMMDNRVAEMSSIGMFDILPTGKLIQANDCWYKSSGHSKDPAAATDYSFLDCVLEDDREFVKTQWDILGRGIPVTFEMRWKAAKPEVGEAKSETSANWVSAACMPVMAEDDTVATISGFTVDISAKKRSAQDAFDKTEALERAESSEKRFSRFAELAPVAIFCFDEKSRMVYCNNMWFEMTGCPPMDFDKIEWDRWVLAEDMPPVGEAVRTLYETKIPITVDCRLNRTWRSADNVEHHAWLSTSAYPELKEDGSVNVVMGTMTDISKYKWAEDIQKLRRDEALESKRQHENFIDMTSHEMRNPLSAVVHSADLLSVSLTQMRGMVKSQHPNELSELFDSCFESVQTIMSCSVHQKRIVDDILTLSKLDSRLLTIAPTEVRPESIVRDALRMFETEALSADVRLCYEQDDSLRQLGVDWVMMDPSRVLQVLINLLTNAIKFTRLEAERVVTVTIKASAKRPAESDGYIPRQSLDDDKQQVDLDDGSEVYIHFLVQDTGRGLSLDEQAGLFNRFSQASPRTHVKYGGSGLGLFVSRQLTELQGGAIKVTSDSESGSTFAFYIKCQRASENQQHRNSVTQLPGSVAVRENSTIEDMHVLIVEDNVVNRAVLSKLLKKRGCKVYIAGNGVEALKIMSTTNRYKGKSETANKLSVVLMDIEMPVMGGLECTTEIRRMQSTGEIVSYVPIVAMSANARKEQIERAMGVGCDDFVSKPFRIEELVEKIVRAVSIGV